MSSNIQFLMQNMFLQIHSNLHSMLIFYLLRHYQVTFDTVAREWRCKWEDSNEKASLTAVQDLVNATLPKIKAIEGVNVQRVVCGGCLDFKLIISLPADRFAKLEEANIEEEFLTALKAIPGCTSVETQTFTLMPL